MSVLEGKPNEALDRVKAVSLGYILISFLVFGRSFLPTLSRLLSFRCPSSLGLCHEVSGFYRPVQLSIVIVTLAFLYAF